MSIFRTIFQSIISIPQTLKDTTFSIAHGAAIFIFSSTHYLLLRGEKAREIADISDLIRWLEQKNQDTVVQNVIQNTLNRLLKNHVFQSPPEDFCLLAAVKAHRYSLQALWRGVGQNDFLLHQMYGYLKHHNEFLPSDSPFKKPAPTSLGIPTATIPLDLN